MTLPGSHWCFGKNVIPSQAPIHQVLDFLQEGLDNGLAPNTLKRQVAALSSVLVCGAFTSLTHHPLVHRFLWGATDLRPPVIHRYPTWDLTKVLLAPTGPPFEPLRDTSLHYLSLKVAFLVAITSTRRISELAALSVR